MRRSGLLAFVAATAVACVISNGSPAVEPSGWGVALENGDSNGDQERDLSDGVYLLNFLFLGGPEPAPLADCGPLSPAVSNGDANGDGAVDVSDAVRLLGWLFMSDAPPAAACGQGGGGNEPRVAPPHSFAFGKTLAGWLETYWRWYFATNSDPAQDMVGRVKLMPIPAGTQTGGSGTPDDPAIIEGSMEVTLEEGTPFVIPQFAWIAERYDPALGIPDDPSLPDDALLAGASTNLSIDGHVIVSDRNERKFYVPATAFDPIVVYPVPTSYGSIAAIRFQGCGVVVLPLSPGVHTMKIDEPYIIRNVLGFSFGVVYHNTWKITVKDDD